MMRIAIGLLVALALSACAKRRFDNPSSRQRRMA